MYKKELKEALQKMLAVVDELPDSIRAINMRVSKTEMEFLLGDGFADAVKEQGLAVERRAGVGPGWYEDKAILDGVALIKMVHIDEDEDA